ncbi:MAG: DnaJ domain-containing protein [Spirochaetaceae bacterium]|nr:DnaJ domain-containing protein [Spirochaetaceae bacterium]
MNDLQVLGISGEYTLESLKKAFRLKSKQLHPDKNTDSLSSHLAMIRVNQAYANLSKMLNEKKEEPELNRKDNAYSIYKAGIDKFQNIHPSKWKSYSKGGLFNAGSIETNREAPKIIQTLMDNMAEAYYKFSIIVNEYPQSCWYTDSKAKLKDIEKMTVRYVKIMNSYKSEEKSEKLKGQ